MMNYEELDNMNVVELGDEELEQIAGGKSRYIEGDSGKSNVRTGPGRDYRSIGVLHKGEEAKYLGKTSTDERGVVWYKIRWNGRDAWVSSMYTRKISY